MNYDRVVAATMESQSVSTVDDPLIELSIPANGVAEIIRVEVGPSEGADPVDEVQEIALWMGTVAGSGGTALTERIVRGEGTSVGAAVRNVSTIGTGNAFYRVAYHTQNGWLYLPVPEERPLLKAGGDDIFAVYFPVAPDTAMTLSATIVWGEVG